MHQIFDLKKGAQCALFFFLLSCQSNPPRWESSEQRGLNPSYNSRLHRWHPEKSATNLGIEILQTPIEERIYLTLDLLSFPKPDDASNQVPVTLTSEDGVSELVGYRLEGGQKVLLAEEAGQLVLRHLRSGRPFQLAIGRFSVDVQTSSK